MPCPCQSGKPFSQCCEPIISGATLAKTAEQLMRARYTAYTKVQMDFIEQTHDPKTRGDIDLAASHQWAETTKWVGLNILDTTQGGPDDQTGTVEFKATFENEEGLQVHHELSQFRKIDGLWYFSDGKTPPVRPIVRNEAKVGRNDPCPCGSGKKYKKCCVKG
jgi:SEC-C motif domain protein